MTTAIFFASVTISLMFVIPTVAGRYGPDVAGRFLEKGVRPKAPLLREWVEKNPNAARGYAAPVLFPLDLLFMIALTGFALFGSTALAEQIALSPDKRWLFFIVPLAYLLTDLVEDSLLALMLTSSERVSEALVQGTYVVTRLKLGAAVLLLTQMIVLSGLALFRR